MIHALHDEGVVPKVTLRIEHHICNDKARCGHYKAFVSSLPYGTTGRTMWHITSIHMSS